MAESTHSVHPSRGGALPAQAWEYEVELGGEAPVEVLDRFAIRERLYAGRMTGKERIRPLAASTADPPATWRPLSAHAEFQDVLQLLGLAEVEGGDKRIRGWRKDVSAVGAQLPHRRASQPGLAAVPPRHPTGKRPSPRPQGAPPSGPAPGPKDDGGGLMVALFVVLGLALIGVLLMI